MTDDEREALVERIGSAILVNLCDRRGIKHALHDIDRDVMDEIRTTLGTIALSAAEPVVREDERERLAQRHDTAAASSSDPNARLLHKQMAGELRARGAA